MFGAAKGVRVEPGWWGERLVVTSEWSDSIARHLRAKGIRELVLNYALGFKGSDVGFLATIPELEGLTLLHWTIDDVSPIHSLRRLRGLDLKTYCKTAIDFSSFPGLEKCVFEWRPKSESLFGCRSLKDLFVNKYKGKDTSAFGALASLESLSICNSPVASLEGLRGLAQLERLELHNLSQLASLRGLEGLGRLRRLVVDGCRKIGRIDELAGLTGLEELHLNGVGPIASLKPLASLAGLGALLFYDDTNVEDGDLSPLLGLGRLARVEFENRKHYSHRTGDFARK